MYDNKSKLNNVPIIPIEILNSVRVMDNHKLLLLLIIFHHNKLINDNSLKGLFNNLRKKTLNRFVKNHYCKLNNTWYYDKRILNIYIDVLTTKVKDTVITIDTFMEYLKLFLNKPKNYCKKYLIDNYIYPFYIFSNGYYNHNYHKQDYLILSMFNISPSLSNDKFITFDKFDVLGYCCEDCDGSYNDYKNNQYYHYLNNNVKDIVNKEFNEYFKIMYKYIW